MRLTIYQVPTIKKDDLLGLGLDALWEKAGCPTCSWFAEFLKKEITKSTIEAKRNALEVICHMCTMSLSINDNKNPFTASEKCENPVSGDVHESVLPQDIPKEDYEPLFTLLRNIENPELKARIADTLFYCDHKKYKCGCLAIESYLASGANIAQSDTDFPMLQIEEVVKRYCRAAQISKLLGGGGNALLQKSLEKCLDYLNSKDINEFGLCAVPLMNILEENNYGSPCDLANKCAEIFKMGCERRLFKVMSNFLVLLKKFLSKAGKTDDEIATIDDMNMMAYQNIATQENDPMRRSVFLKMAIDQARQYGKKDIADNLHNELVNCQRQIPQTFSSNHFDISSQINQMSTENMKLLEGCASLRDALEKFSLNLKLPQCCHTKEELAKLLQENIEAQLFGKIYTDGAGKTLKKAPPVDFGCFKEEDPGVQAVIYEKFCFDLQICSASYVDPLLDKISSQYFVEDDLLTSVLSASGFVPDDRLDFFLYGIKAGLEKDFAKASLALVPQLENSFRTILLKDGFTPSSLLGDGTQKEKDLNVLLKDPPFCDAIKTKLGVNNFEVLRRLYINPNDFGLNFRNNIAHGLLPLDILSGCISAYSWAFIMYLIYHFKK